MAAVSAPRDRTGAAGVSIRIERLSIEGFSARDGRRVQDGFAAELQRLVAREPLAAALAERLAAGAERTPSPRALQVGAGEAPERVGRRAARAFLGGLVG